ncbi:MAG: DNA modification methylase [Planctomycetota bacterium]
MRLPVHSWFRYSAGFSASWVRGVLQVRSIAEPVRLLDPFAGSGTSLIEAEWRGARSIGIEAHPFIVRVARAKLGWRSDPDAFGRLALEILELARARDGSLDGYPDLVRRCFTDEALLKLDALRRAWEALRSESQASELAWLALASILRPCASVGTAPWQYVLPSKPKVRVQEPFDAFDGTCGIMVQDMREVQAGEIYPTARVYQGDARECADVPDGWANVVLSSPPYANNFDYADATRLEMSFFGEVSGWGDLQDAVRRWLIRSCTQHVAGDGAWSEEDVAPIVGPLRKACARLAEVREKHGGRKAYHTMAACYFADLARVWRALRRAVRPGGLVGWVVGDSAPYGVHLPVERWLGELAIAAGFRKWKFFKLRERNTRWKNRKHRVLLKEGILWVEA